MSILRAEHIKKTYWDNNQDLLVLSSVDLTVERGETACIIGQSGSGKSTLLHILGLLDNQTSGTVYYNDRIVCTSSKNINQVRNKLLGFVFQFHYLLDDLTALENVFLPSYISGEKKGDSLVRAKDLMQRFGLKHRINHYPYQLSGGEQQRVAIARALINNPLLIFADEPTGNLDPEHSEEVNDVLFTLNRIYGCSLVIVTHDERIAVRAQSKYNLKDGVLKKQN